MEYKTKKIENASVQINVTHNSEEVENAYKSAYRKASTKVKIPGFRSGKAPLELVEKQLGDSVIEDAAKILISDTMKEVMEKLDPPPINVPSFEVEKFDRKKGASFTGKYDTFPDIKPGKYKKLKATLDVVKVSDSDVDNYIKNLRERNAVLKNREDSPAENGDQVTADLDIRHSGKSIYKKQEAQFRMGEAGFPGIDENLLGVKEGDEKSFDVSIPEEFPDPKYAGKNLNIHVKIHQCLFPELPELNDDFAKEVNMGDTVAALREKVLKELNNYGEEVLKNRASEELLKKLVEDSKIEIPESMVEREFQQRVEHLKSRIGASKDTQLDEIAKKSGITHETLVKDITETSRKVLADNLVILEVTKTEDLSVTDEDLKEEMKKRWSLPDEQIESLVKSPEIRQEMEGRLLFRKGLDYIFENADLKKGKVVEYTSLIEEHQH